MCTSITHLVSVATIVTLTIPVNANAELVLLYKTLVLESISMVSYSDQIDRSN